MKIKIGLILLIMWMLNGMLMPEGNEKQTERLFGQSYPGHQPEMFFRGQVSTKGGIEFAVSIAPKEKGFYFIRFVPGKGKFAHYCEFDQGNISKPRPVDHHFRFSYDGKYRYYEKIADGFSHRSPDAQYDLWISSKIGDRWGKSIKIKRPDIVSRHWNPFITGDGKIYFNAPGKSGKQNICVARFDGKKITEINYLDAINGGDAVYVEPVIDPEGRYMLFYSAGRADNFSQKMVGDIYVSFKMDNGQWSRAYNLGDKINSVHEETFPAISPDGKLIFFSRPHGKHGGMPSIHWVRADFILSIKEGLKNQ